MKKAIFVVLTVATLSFLGKPGLADFNYASGLGAAVKNYGLGKLIAAAKRSDPNSAAPTVIEYVLAGISIASNPVAVGEAVYPGALAAGAIGQLIDKHGADIARNTYRDSSVFVGGKYGDPSLIPDGGQSGKPDEVLALCGQLFEVENVNDCRRLTRKIQACNAEKKPSALNIRHCNEILAEFYDDME